MWRLFYSIAGSNNEIKKLILGVTLRKYGSECTNKMKEIFERIIFFGRGSALVKIVSDFDDICSHCPFNARDYCKLDVENGMTREKRMDIDKESATHFGLELNKTYSLNELITILKF